MSRCYECDREIEAYDPFTLDGHYFCSNWCLIAYRKRRAR
jgi:hypothetical protein